MWNPKGGELYYYSPQNDLMAVTATRSGRSWAFGDPARLFGEAVFEPVDTATSYYAPSPDGQRFLTIAATSTAANNQASPLIVTINWQSLLKH
jgi:hypothetical protein